MVDGQQEISDEGMQSVAQRTSTVDTREIYKIILDGQWDYLNNIFDRESDSLTKILFVSPITLAGDTVLHFSVRETPVLQKLLQHLKKMNRTDEDHKTALSMKNYYGNTPLHMAASLENSDATELLLNESAQLLYTRNKSGETAMFRAATFGRKKVLKFLFNFMKNHREGDEGFLDKLEDQCVNKDGLSILHVAVRGRHIDTALWIEKNIASYFDAADKSLDQRKDKRGMTCLQLLAEMEQIFRSGFSLNKLESFIYWCLPVEVDDVDAVEGTFVPNKFERGLPAKVDDVEGNFFPNKFERGLPAKVDDVEGTFVPNKFERGLPAKVDDVEGTFVPNKFERVIGEISRTVLNFLIKVRWTKDLRKKKEKHEYAKQLTSLLAVKDLSWELSYVTTSEEGDGDKRNNEKDKTSEDGDGDIRKNEKDTDPNNTDQQKPLTPANLAAILAGSNVQQKPSTPSNVQQKRLTPLLLAASNGIKEITDIILDEYPQAIDHVPANQQNILHVTIQHRHKEVFRDLNQRLKTKEWSMERLVRREDKDGNNILHQVGTITYCRDEGLTNPSLRLQDELEWFERVKDIVPEHYITARNDKDQTPKEYFDEAHKKQLEEAHNWAKDTSQSCSTVAALVATIVFAAAYTVPGGSDKGVPYLRESPLFKTFTYTDIFALGTSLTSLVLFLSILTSPFRYEDFRASIPRRMQFGFFCLTLSVASSMVTFTVSILLTTNLEREWTKSFIYIVGFLPVLIFLWNNSLLAGFQFPCNALKDFLVSSFQFLSNKLKYSSLPCFKRSCKRTKPDDLENPEATQDA